MQRCNYAANGAMQTSSAAYNEKSRSQLNLRGVDPAEAVRFNPEFRCQTVDTPELLIICYEQLEEFDSEIVRSLAETQTFYGFAYTSKTYDCCYKELK